MSLHLNDSNHKQDGSTWVHKRTKPTNKKAEVGKPGTIAQCVSGDVVQLEDGRVFRVGWITRHDGEANGHIHQDYDSMDTIVERHVWLKPETPVTFLKIRPKGAIK